MMKRCFWALVALCASAGLNGCATNETTVTTHASSVAVAVTESVAVSVSSETTTVTQATEQTPSSTKTVDILEEAKKPCGTVAADAPKFTDPEEEK